MGFERDRFAEEPSRSVPVPLTRKAKGRLNHRDTEHSLGDLVRPVDEDLGEAQGGAWTLEDEADLAGFYGG